MVRYVATSEHSWLAERFDEHRTHLRSGLAYWDVGDIAAKLEALQAAGGTVVQPVTDVGYGLLVASVKDPNGVTIGLRQKPKG